MIIIFAQLHYILFDLTINLTYIDMMDSYMWREYEANDADCAQYTADVCHIQYIEN